jgi:DNA-binding NtrC family response regulator
MLPGQPASPSRWPFPPPGAQGEEMEDFSELNLIGRSPAFLSALNLIRKFAACDATVLVEGETGTGKELAARAIHYLGSRRDFPFIPVNCGALPDTLIENELFGHARGAFTDARDARQGLVAQAEGGTLFLDEIEALSIKGQVVLLRFLQDRAYRPLGARSQIDGNVRVVTASNTDLSDLVRSGALRRDLLYRLAVLSVRMPPLRERLGDVGILASHFLHRFSCQYRQIERALEADSARVIDSYSWPGNVRELENLLLRAFLLCDTERIRVRSEDLGIKTEAAIDTDALTHSGPSFASAKASAIAQFESNYLRRALSDADGNVTLAARRSGKERRSFGKLLKKHRIDRSQYTTD